MKAVAQIACSNDLNLLDGDLSLALLGTAGLRTGDQHLIALERKSAAVLAYLALSGVTSRSRLAGLLWPDTDEDRARNNLSQTLRRLKLVAGRPLVEGQSTLLLSPGLESDANALLHAAQSGDLAVVAENRRELLANLDFDDCPDFERWLLDRRDTFARLHEDALEELAERAEAAGQPRVAIGFAKRLVDVNPVSEVAFRRVMRLHAMLGDFAAATAAYERCRATLAAEFAIRPGPETRALFQEIEAAGAARRPMSALNAALAARIPYRLLRPANFVGRENELARMEAAWLAGRALFVSGEAGIGKTRLMQEFLADKGRCYVFEGYPEDRNAAYSTYSRTFREVMRAFPNLRFPDWVIREAARILPELGGMIGIPIDAPERLRFFQALAEANDLAVRAGMRRVVVDDLHLCDPASLEAGHFVYSRHWGRADGMQTVMVLRPEAFDPAGRAAMDRVLDRGLGVEILLGELSLEEVRGLLGGIEPAWERWAERLYGHCGGNPFFVLETLKVLTVDASLPNALPAELPLAGTIRTLLTKRMAQLSPDALLAARLTALSGGEVDTNGLARLIARSAADLVAPLAELETAGVLRDGRLVHGLWQHMLAESMPRSLRGYLLAQLDREM